MSLNSVLDLEKSQNIATALIVENIQHVETSIQLAHALDKKLLKLLKEKLEETFDVKNDWWRQFQDDFSDLTFAPRSPLNWYSQASADAGDEFQAWFGLYIDSEYPNIILGKFYENWNFSLVSRLVQQNTEANKGFAIGFCIQDSHKRNKDKKPTKKDYVNFVAKNASEITDQFGFQMWDNGDFYLPFSLDAKLLSDAICNDDFEECLKPFDEVLAKVKASVPEFTKLIRKIEGEKLFSASILPANP